MQLIKLSEISSKIMSLIDEAEQRFVAVSPYVKISKWDKMKKKLSSLAHRRIACFFYVRDGEPLALEELKAIGIVPYTVRNLHCKLYFNEKEAIVTSMNLLYSSEVNSIELAYATTTKDEYDEIIQYYKKNIEGNIVEAGKEADGEPYAKNTGLGDSADKLRKDLENLGRSYKVVLNDTVLTIKGPRYQYECFIANDLKNRLRLKCELSKSDQTRFRAKMDLIAENNYYVKLDFQNGNDYYKPILWGTGKEPNVSTTIEKALLDEYQDIKNKVYYFIESIEDADKLSKM